MMASTSNLEQQERNWLDLPSDVMANILTRIGIVDILENAQKVCTAWHKVCKNPAMYRVINMNHLLGSTAKISRALMCKHAVDRSQGQLVDITIFNDHDAKLFLYVADRSSQLRRLEIACGMFLRSLTIDPLMKFPLLEELNLYAIRITKEEIETVGRYCPMLKTLKVNERVPGNKMKYFITDEDASRCLNEVATAIGKNLLGLRHLELIGNDMTNVGLQVILDNCNYLESLDLRACAYIDLKGDLGEKCYKQIKSLKLPNDPLEGGPYFYYNLSGYRLKAAPISFKETLLFDDFAWEDEDN